MILNINDIKYRNLITLCLKHTDEKILKLLDGPVEKRDEIYVLQLLFEGLLVQLEEQDLKMGLE